MTHRVASERSPLAGPSDGVFPGVRFPSTTLGGWFVALHHFVVKPDEY
jgi:hypothetical protein